MNRKDKKFALSFILIAVIMYLISWCIPLAVKYVKSVEEALSHDIRYNIFNSLYVFERSIDWIQLFLYKFIIVWRSTNFSKVKSNTLVYFLLSTFIFCSGFEVVSKVLETMSYYGLYVSDIFAKWFGPRYNIFDFIPLLLGMGLTVFSHFHGKRYSFKDINSDKYDENKNYIYMKKSSKFIEHWRALMLGLPSGNFGFVIQGKLAKFNRENGRLEYTPFHNNNKYCLKEISTGGLIFEHNVSKLKTFFKNKAKLCKKLGYNVKNIFRK